jgi:hypothetical protein
MGWECSEGSVCNPGWLVPVATATATVLESAVVASHLPTVKLETTHQSSIVRLASHLPTVKSETTHQTQPTRPARTHNPHPQARGPHPQNQGNQTHPHPQNPRSDSKPKVQHTKFHLQLNRAWKQEIPIPLDPQIRTRTHSPCDRTTWRK